MKSKLKEIRKAIKDRKITREEVLLEIFKDGGVYDDNEILNLWNLDFSDYDIDIYISNMKVKGDLYQDNQEVKGDLVQNRHYYIATPKCEIFEKENYKTHKLKIDKQYLDALLDGTKTFEIRYNDRGYKVGDYLIFENKHKFKITYITDYEQKEGYVVMSVERVE